MKDLFTEPIKRLVVILVAVFFIAIALMFALENYIKQTNIAYDIKINNSKEKSSLSKILTNKLFRMENYYLRIAYSDNMNEVKNFAKGFNSFSDDFSQIMDILTKGGTFEKKTRINGINKSEITEKITYFRNDTGYILEVIELKPLLISVKNSEKSLLKKVETKLKNKAELSKKEKEKMNFSIKKTSANYNRMLESVKKMHYNIASEIQEIKDKKTKQGKKLYQIKKISIVSVLLLISIITIIIFTKLSRLIRENKKYTADIENSRKEVQEYAENIKKQNERMLKMIEGIKQSSGDIAYISVELSNLSQTVSDRANNQAEATEEVAKSVENMLLSISSNASKAKITGETSEKSATEMQESNEIFIQTLRAVSEISERISIISEIANKTDVLSINAAIEAARSGEIGKGFAVVAQEIRKLADKTKAASFEITELAENGQKMSQIAEKKLRDTIEEILNSARFVSEIVLASQEQQSNVAVINSSVQQLSNITGENSQSAKQMAISAEKLSVQAEMLSNLISSF